MFPAVNVQALHVAQQLTLHAGHVSSCTFRRSAVSLSAMLLQQLLSHTSTLTAGATTHICTHTHTAHVHHRIAPPLSPTPISITIQVGLKVADLQEQSAANRKQLADATREFKRSTASAADSEYVRAVAALLKRYQEEIDALTRRAKHGVCLCRVCV